MPTISMLRNKNPTKGKYFLCVMRKYGTIREIKNPVRKSPYIKGMYVKIVVSFVREKINKLTTNKLTPFFFIESTTEY